MHQFEWIEICGCNDALVVSKHEHEYDLVAERNLADFDLFDHLQW